MIKLEDEICNECGMEPCECEMESNERPENEFEEEQYFDEDDIYEDGIYDSALTTGMELGLPEHLYVGIVERGIVGKILDRPSGLYREKK